MHRTEAGRVDERDVFQGIVGQIAVQALHRLHGNAEGLGQQTVG
jgi:hypothetical protein